MERAGARGAQGREIEGSTDSGATAADVALAAPSTAVMVERSQAGEGGDLLSGGVAQFGKIRQETKGGAGTDSAVGDERGVLSTQGGSSLHLLVERDPEGFDLAFDRDQRSFEGRSGEGELEMFAMVEELGADGHELVAQGNELAERVSGGIGSGRGLGLHGRAVVGQDAGINGIGLDEAALCPSEVTDPLRIDHAESNGVLLQVGDELSLVAPGGFDDHLATRGQQGAEPPKAGGGVRQTAGLIEEETIQGGFGNIDSDLDLRCSGHKLFLVNASAAASLKGGLLLATVRVMNGRPAVILLYNGNLQGNPRRATITGEPQPWRRPPPGLPSAPLESLDPKTPKCRHYSILRIYKGGRVG